MLRSSPDGVDSAVMSPQQPGRFRFPAALAAAALALCLMPTVAPAIEARLPRPRPVEASPTPPSETTTDKTAATDSAAATIPRPRPTVDDSPALDEAAADAAVAPEAETQQAATPEPGAPTDESTQAAETPPPPAADAAEDNAAEAAPADAAGTPAVETQGAQSNAEGAPLPRPRPELDAAEAARLLAAQFYGFQPDFKIRAALDAVEDGRYADARALAATHENAMVAALVAWEIARQSDSGLSAPEIIEVLATHPGWPEPERLQLRAEQAFHALGPSGDPVIAFYNQVEPVTVAGRLSLAAALRDAGRSAEAEPIVRDLWRNWSLSPTQSAAMLARFGAMLTRADQIYRFRRLVLREQTRDAAAQGDLVGPGYADLARAVVAALDRKKDAAQQLRGVAKRFLGDPLYVFARTHQLLRSNQPIEAARFLLETRPNLELSGDGDIWWEERRDLARALLDSGAPELAYRVVAEARPDGEGDRVEAAFHAGWIALRFLHDPNLAEPHFRELHTLATLPRTQSRASYWLGRTHEAQHRPAAARLDYVEAARFGGTFYGQLAREKLGITTTGLERMPRPSALDRIRFANRDMVKIVRLLAAGGHADMAWPFLAALGETVDTPGEVALLTTLARRIGRPEAGIQAAATAEERGLKVASLPALFFGVPADLRTPAAVDRALVYAVVRQESAFNHAAVSNAGARGLMQLMPATARATARNASIPFSVQRLTTDPLYNVTLGAHHLDELLGGLQRSYILTFVGYNAGPGRALQWVHDYGDPRGGAVDPIDWIERIPFDETRDYVQKVMENLQLYRSRTGHPLSLTQDLLRGGPQG
jgi:peptidoglycan lytic transglycosylase